MNGLCNSDPLFQYLSLQITLYTGHKGLFESCLQFERPFRVLSLGPGGFSSIKISHNIAACSTGEGKLVLTCCLLEQSKCHHQTSVPSLGESGQDCLKCTLVRMRHVQLSTTLKMFCFMYTMTLLMMLKTVIKFFNCNCSRKTTLQEYHGAQSLSCLLPSARHQL